MKISWIKKTESHKLLMFFGGFASDENLIKDFDFDDFDVIMFSDYRNFDCEIPEEIFSYLEVYTAAWSFGVWAADFMLEKLPESKMRIALCGTPFPVDGERGIAPEIFEGTATNFSESTKEKFLMRVFGVKDFETSKKFFASRTAEEEKEELKNLGKAFKQFSGKPENWTRAIAARNDKIFSLKAMENAWGKKLEIISGEHFPLSIFADGFARVIINTHNIAKSFGKSFDSYDKEADVQKKIANHLAKLLLKRLDESKVKNVLEIGVGTGFLTKALAKKLGHKRWHLNDLSADALNYTKNILDTIPAFIHGDAQIQDFPPDMDLIVSASCFQWMEELDTFLLKLAALCKPGSILAFSTFLPENLREIRSLAGKGLNYVGIVGLESMLARAGFEILCSEAETIKLEFETPMAVLRHLRETGVGGSFSEFWTPQKLKNFSRQYSEFFPSGKGVSLTYRPIYFVAEYKGKNSLS